MVAVAKPVSGTVSAEGADAAASTRSEFRKAPADVNRIPGSAASMKVQERSKANPTSSAASTSTSATPATSRITAPNIASLRNRTAIQAMQPFLDSSTTADSPIQPTDIQLLTTSILSNQERQRVILSYQEKLIHSQPTLPELKQSLLFLSSSSWGQILEERKLADKCAYPPCHRPSPSFSSSGAARGKFRINLRTQSVRAVDDLDLGEAGHTYDDLRDYFCSKPCYARSEWILRWVLSDKEIALPDSQGSQQGSGGSGGGVALQGKWQKLTSQPEGYEHIELLEDIEREQGVSLTDLDPEQSLQGVEDASPISPSSGSATASTSRRDEPPATPAKCDVTNLLGDLTIVERSKQPSPQHPSIDSTANSQNPSRTAYTVDVPNTLGARFTATGTAAHDGEAGDMDLEAELDEREREMAHVLRYASLARGSRPRRRNLTIRLDAGPATTTGGREAGEEVGGSDSETVDAQEAAERREIRRMMDVALDVRRAQREQGLLD